MRVGSSIPRPLRAPASAASRRAGGPAAVDPVGGKSAKTADRRGRPSSNPERSAGNPNLTSEELRVIQKLRARDQEVRAHEAAHQSAGGTYASAPRFQYETGPDGQRYAIGGEVQIDTSPVAGDPAATLRKEQVIAHAALAPAHPSAQDQAVAQQAEATAAQARIQLLLKRSSVEGAESPALEGSREVKGEYLAASASEGPSRADAGSRRNRESTAIQALKTVQGMGAAELIRLGGRLDTHA